MTYNVFSAWDVKPYSINYCRRGRYFIDYCYQRPRRLQLTQQLSSTAIGCDNCHLLSARY